MIISHQNKFIYVHIPKTAGKSITSFLSNKPVERTPIHSKLIPDVNFLQNYTRITSVRHPLDRLVSWFFWTQKQMFFGPVSIRTELNTISNISFQEFVKERIAEGLSSHFYTIHPQTTWFDLDHPYHHIIRFENLHNDVQEIAEIFGINNSFEHINKNNIDRDHFMTYYDQEMLDIAYEFYKEDFISLNYRI